MVRPVLWISRGFNARVFAQMRPRTLTVSLALSTISAYINPQTIAELSNLLVTYSLHLQNVLQ